MIRVIFIQVVEVYMLLLVQKTLYVKTGTTSEKERERERERERESATGSQLQCNDVNITCKVVALIIKWATENGTSGPSGRWLKKQCPALLGQKTDLQAPVPVSDTCQSDKI